MLGYISDTCGIVNELSTSIDLESTLIRAESLFRRFQRTVEAIDKKSNFPTPTLRQRQNAQRKSSSTGGAQSPLPSPVASAELSANTSSVDAVTAGSTNSGTGARRGRAGRGGRAVDKGKRNASPAEERRRGDEELADQRPKVISPELRELLSRRVEVLPRKVVRKEGEGLSSLKK